MFRRNDTEEPREAELNRINADTVDRQILLGQEALDRSEDDELDHGEAQRRQTLDALLLKAIRAPSFSDNSVKQFDEEAFDRSKALMNTRGSESKRRSIVAAVYKGEDLGEDFLNSPWVAPTITIVSTAPIFSIAESNQ